MSANVLQDRLDAVMGYSQQLTAIILQETALLKNGKAGALAASEADKTRAMALYQRELNALHKDTGWQRKISEPMKSKLKDNAARLQAALKDQARLLARRRHVTEGFIQAIAKDIASKRQGASPYGRPTGAPPRSTAAATAIALNAVA